MAAGDVFQQGVTTITSGYFDIQPNAGVEIVIHNIAHSASAVLEFYDGSASIVIDTHTGAGAWTGMFLHCTNSKRYRVSSIGSASNNIACDGMQTK